MQSELSLKVSGAKYTGSYQELLWVLTVKN